MKRYATLDLSAHLTLLSQGLMGSVVASITLWNSWTLLRVSAPDLWDAYRTVVLYPTDIIVAFGLLAWLLARVSKRGGWQSMRWGDRSANFAALLLVSTSVAAAIGAPSQAIAFAGVGRLVLYWLVYLYIVNDPRFLSWALPAIVVALAMQAGIAGWQVISQTTTPLAALISSWPRDLEAADAGASVVQLADGSRFLRAYGSFPHPNILAGYVAAMLVLVINRFRIVNRATAVGLGVLIPVTVATLFLSFSRGSWLAVIGGLLFVAFCWSPSRLLSTSALRTLIVGGACAVVIAVLAIVLREQVAARLTSDSVLELRSLVERQMLQDYAAELVSENRWLGSGVGNYLLAAASRPEAPVTFEPPHSVPLLAAAEVGLIGAAAWIFLSVLPVGQSLIDSMRRRRFVPSCSVAAVSAVILVSSFFDHYWWTQPPIALLPWIVLGAWYSRRSTDQIAVQPASVVNVR